MAGSKIERIQAALRGQPVDRPPYSFWFHYPCDQVAGRPAAEAHLATYRKFDADLLKVMNDNGYDLPPGTGQVTSAARLAALPPAPLESACFQNQLEALREIQKQLKGQCYVVTTLFSPLSVAEKITGGRTADLLAEDRDAAMIGLGHIADSLAGFAGACLDAGADGIFMSVQDGINRQLGDGFYRECIRGFDTTVFRGARRATINILHVHGEAMDFETFLDYPVEVINWADRASGPAIGDVVGRMRQTILGGMDHEGTIPAGDPAALAAEIRDAVEQAGDHGLIIGPGCSFPSDTPDEMFNVVAETCKALAR